MCRFATGLLLTLLGSNLFAVEVGSERVPDAGEPAVARAAAVATSPGQWTWDAGSDRVAEVDRLGVYGSKGVADPGNVPGARRDATTWRDGAGNLWLFGGWGFARSAVESTLNDLWRWDGSTWTWVGGSDGHGQAAVYGTQGVPAAGNDPGARYGAASWVDASGNTWLFGGGTQIESQALGDLWKWDGTNWTWVNGANVPDQPGVYGTKGVPAPGNRPGARRNAVTWVDAGGRLWLFGGRGTPSYPSGNKMLNDLWNWDGTSWTWVGGSDVAFQPGVYGTKGTASPTNAPGARFWATTCSGPDGRVWLHGGFGIGAATGGQLNDLWSWDGTNWTWVGGSDAPGQASVYGTKGIPDLGNVPGARMQSVSWTDAVGRVWLLGGTTRTASIVRPGDLLNDLWRWDGASWTWMRGSAAAGATGAYGTKGVADPANEPGARYGTSLVLDASGLVTLWGGSGSSATGNLGPLNDLWRWNGSAWTWAAGSNGTSQAGAYGVKGLASPSNRPGARKGAVTWRTADGNTWLFGGWGYSAAGRGYLSDLWRWDGTSWTWISGSDREEQPGVRGTKGVPATANVPGARAWSVGWTDATGSLWLFGGACPDPYDEGLTNDLWRWDGSNWTWMGGSDSPWQAGVYGVKGVPSASNVPGARWRATAWAGAAGNLWLFGGYGAARSASGYLNDLWRWDGTAWTWVHGSDEPSSGGERGNSGVPAPDNVPAAAATGGGSIWLYGGDSLGSAPVDDLWRWDGAYWTRYGGTQALWANGEYGEQGISAPGNRPGGRADGAAWVDARGHFWLFGGRGSSAAGRGTFNDLWRWDGTNWTWIHGSDVPDSVGVYGAIGTPAIGNEPGGRTSPATWRGADGALRLLGGSGVDSEWARGLLADLWSFEVPGCSPPSSALTAPDSVPEGSAGHLASVADAGAGATYEWSIAGGMVDSGQGTPTITFSPAPGATSIDLSLLVRVGDCAARGEKAIPVGAFHRLDVVRNGSGNVSIAVGATPVSCDQSCSAIVAHGALVELTANPFQSARFAGWLGGSCSGAASCTFTMSGPTTVSATFLQKAAASFHTLAPCRVVDTRNAQSPFGDVPAPWSAPALTAGASRAFDISGPLCGVPADATAVALNVTVTAPTNAGSLTLYPGTGPAPEATTIHFPAGRTRANNVTMGLVGGVLSVLDRQETGTVELIVDVSGYYR